VAWQPDPTVRITLHFRDDDGADSQHIINVAASALPVAGGFATAYANLFPPVSNCALWKVTVHLRYLDNADPVGAAGSSINQRSVLVFGTAAAERLSVSIPGLETALLLAPPDPYAGVGLDTSNPAIAALVAAHVTGLGGVAPCAPWGPGVPAGDFTWPGSDLVELLTAYWGYQRAWR
jgi:hypothetical protein